MTNSTGLTFNLNRPNEFGGAGEVLDARGTHTALDALRAYRPGDTIIVRPATGPRMLDAWTPVTRDELDAPDRDALPLYAQRTLDAYAAALPAPAPALDMHEFMVCVDCMQYVAGIDAQERGEEYPPAVIDAMTAPDAASWTLVNACGEDCDACHDFSGAPCDTCASWLAGERHAVVALSR